jgi:hypothetical protein
VEVVVRRRNGESGFAGIVAGIQKSDRFALGKLDAERLVLKLPLATIRGFEVDDVEKIEAALRIRAAELIGEAASVRTALA